MLTEAVRDVAMAGRINLRRWIARTATFAGVAGCAIVLAVSVAPPVVVPVSHSRRRPWPT
jgi:hypothetical protein